MAPSFITFWAAFCDKIDLKITFPINYVVYLCPTIHIALGGRREIKVVVTCCRPDAAGLTVLIYMKLCYVEHNTVSPAASGRQHIMTTFISLLPPSDRFTDAPYGMLK